MTVPLIRLEKSLLGHLNTAFRVTVCPTNLAFSTGAREEEAVEPIKVRGWQRPPGYLSTY